ncbi:PREDICTED: mucin-5AC-like [Priapulus caudatus]|uniref:Mucin-5AC-like n=1 Tax=Priapulus caudatus TaxID=37621 RepID=A0ABM1EJ79_PRICU|nr:PREDICTED: mucin-5AC-like [Priapulus caudatus]
MMMTVITSSSTLAPRTTTPKPTTIAMTSSSLQTTAATTTAAALTTTKTTTTMTPLPTSTSGVDRTPETPLLTTSAAATVTTTTASLVTSSVSALSTAQTRPRIELTPRSTTPSSFSTDYVPVSPVGDLIPANYRTIAQRRKPVTKSPAKKAPPFKVTAHASTPPSRLPSATSASTASYTPPPGGVSLRDLAERGRQTTERARDMYGSSSSSSSSSNNSINNNSSSSGTTTWSSRDVAGYSRNETKTKPVPAAVALSYRDALESRYTTGSTSTPPSTLPPNTRTTTALLSRPYSQRPPSNTYYNNINNGINDDSGDDSSGTGSNSANAIADASVTSQPPMTHSTYAMAANTSAAPAVTASQSRVETAVTSSVSTTTTSLFGAASGRMREYVTTTTTLAPPPSTTTSWLPAATRQSHLLTTMLGYVARRQPTYGEREREGNALGDGGAPYATDRPEDLDGEVSVMTDLQQVRTTDDDDDGNGGGSEDDGWTQWSEWSTCARTCGCSRRSRSRRCHAGLCSGVGLEAEDCRVTVRSCGTGRNRYCCRGWTPGTTSCYPEALADEELGPSL